MSDGEYSRAAYVEEPALPTLETLERKTAAVQEIRDIYDRNGWECKNWHIALFYMFSEEDLAELRRYPEAARRYGDAAELFGTLRTYSLLTSILPAILSRMEK
ncbi:hypothetical protein NQ176_g7223 [Zarea fungicola]|uniref:Uncharacterized protein n=1 Tax=Zarea fungicola TaxID=93591 RepID=A0ACC1N1G0_9HYPO|nr:hypothetical protein NQ176_g7223 [Lecanicillium fungicola]